MKKMTAGRVTILIIVLIVAAIACYQAHGHSQVAAVTRKWQSKLDNAHLVGATQPVVLAYLKSNNLDPENTHGWFDYDQSPSQVKANGAGNNLGPTYSASVYQVADTFEPLPMNWMIDIDLQFDKHGKLLFYKVEPDESGV